MADQTAIEWCDATWNPTSGCTRASEGCDNCYAARMTKRLAVMNDASKRKYSGLINPGKDHFNGVVKCHEDELLTPLGWKKPRRIFAGSMSDIFHKQVPFEFIDKIMAVVALCPQHTFQMLTKRPERMAEYFSQPRPWAAALDALFILDERMYSSNVEFLNEQSRLKHFKGDDLGGLWRNGFTTVWTDKGEVPLPIRWPLPNLWLGTSVENQEQADKRIPHLLQVPAVVRFLSCEPLIGELDLGRWLFDRCSRCGGSGGYYDCSDGGQGDEDCRDCDGLGYDYEYPLGTDNISWVIVGGESGPNARPMHPDWARSLRDQCVAAGVPFFFKQWGELVTEDQSPEDIILPCTSTCYFAVPKNKSDRDYMGGDQTGFYKVGKKAAGRLLDGRTWDEYPEVARG